MKRRVTQTFVVIAISLFIPIISTYFDCCNLAEADFLSCDLSYENPDQDSLSIDQQNESKVFLSSAFSILFDPGIILFQQLSHFPFTLCSLDQETFILRC